MDQKWWYALIGVSVRGPLDAGSLKSLADNGQLRPHDLVRRGDEGKWVPARHVSGLFEGSMAEEPEANDFRPIEPMPRLVTVESEEHTRARFSLPDAALVAIILIILALALDLYQLLYTTFGKFSRIDSGLLFFIDRIKFTVGCGGLLYFLFVFRAKQTR